MTKREELMLAVVEAARDWKRACDGGSLDDRIATAAALHQALSALDDLPAEAEGVEVVAAVFRDARGVITVYGSSDVPHLSKPAYPGEQHIATLRARVPLPRIPEVAADVEGV